MSSLTTTQIRRLWVRIWEDFRVTGVGEVLVEGFMARKCMVLRFHESWGTGLRPSGFGMQGVGLRVFRG